MANKMYILGIISVVTLVAIQPACGGDETSDSGWSVERGDGADTDYGSDTTVVTTPGDLDESVIVTGDPDECVEVEQACIDVDQAKQDGGKYCDDPDSQADVVVVDGEVVEVICYPPKADGGDIREASTDENGDPQIPQTESGSVVTFGEDTDGQPIEGDLSLDAERTTLYGNGPDQTVVDGDVTVASNNSRMRGLTVTGNVEYTDNSNNSALSFCRIQGNLAVHSNGMTITNSQIFGDLTVDGDGATLVILGIQGQWDSENSPDCQGCYAFEDANDDLVVQDSEVGDAL